MTEMPRIARRKRAILNSVLVYVDEPQLIYLDTSGSAKIVGVAVPTGPGTMPFFAAEVSGKQWERYLREQVDLRYLLQYPSSKKWYLFDFMDIGKQGIFLSTTAFSEEYLPDAGFFSRHHTEAHHGKNTQSTQEFDVDGAWDLNDFSEFYARISDLYAFYGAERNWSDPSIGFDIKQKTKTAFLRSWRGGANYVNFFNDLYTAQPYADRLAVHSIQYASPGTVKVDGNATVFDAVISALGDYAQSRSAVQSAYRELYKHLSQHGYLRLQGNKAMLDPGEAEYVIGRATQLASMLKFVDLNFLIQMSDRNMLIATKALLAVVRRTESLFNFFAEGRVSLPSEEVRFVDRGEPAVT